MERCLFVSVEWNFLLMKLQKSHCNIRNLSLSRNDANSSKLETRNLYASINCNFIQVLWFFSLSSVLLIFFVNEIYFSFVIGSNSTCPSYAVAISFMIKYASYPDNYGKLRECNANLYNLYYNLNERDFCIDRSNGNNRALAYRLMRTIFHTRGSA